MERRVSKAQQAVLFGEEPPRPRAVRRVPRAVQSAEHKTVKPAASLGQPPAKLAETLEHYAELHPGWMFAGYMQDAAKTIRTLLQNNYQPTAAQWVKWYDQVPGRIKITLSLNDYKDICTAFMSHLGLK